MNAQQSLPKSPEIGHWVKPRHMWAVAILLVAAAIIGSFLRFTQANTDYICTQVVTTNGTCTNGTWGTWQTTSQIQNGGTITRTQQRTYTGTRAISQSLSYLNLRTACQSGYSQAVNGDSGGASGFHGGNVTTQYSACQVLETKTISTAAASGSARITATQEDLGPAQTSSQAVASLEELNGYANGTGGSGLRNIALALEARPTLVRSGDTSTVTWSATGVVSCTVTGTNGDSWTGPVGTHGTLPIMAQTVYTLSCQLDDGETLASTATVNVTPQFEEQ